MTALVVQEPTSLVAVHDQCVAIETWAEQCTSIAELRDASNKLAAIDEYLSRTSTEGRGRVAEAMRRLEVRVGKLLGPTTTGTNQHTSEGSFTNDPSLTKQQRSQFRAMADNEDAVDDVISESTDEKPASRRKVMQAIKDRSAAAQKNANGHTDRSRSAVAARENEIREMARKGFSFVQMANRLDISREAVNSIAKRLSVEITADLTMGRVRHKKFDGDRIISTVVHDLEGARMTLDFIDYSELDSSRIEGWVDSLTDSIRALNKLKTNLVKESTHEER